MGSKCRTRIAIIVAAGNGTRFGAKKQFIEVNRKPLYYYSIKAFCELVDRVILVVPREDVDKIEPYGAIVVAGGENRYDSVYEGLRLCTEDSLIAIHDAARPGITKDVITKAFEAAEEYGAAVPVVPVVDTIRTLVGELLDRSNLCAMQTPQTFKGEIIIESYKKLMETEKDTRNNMKITDDIQVVELMLGIKGHFSEGNSLNKKVTMPSDIDNLQFT